MKYKTKLLPDEPANSSAFNAHQILADSVFNLITDEPKGQSIALFGAWGSGKSTVINLLEKKAISHNKNSVLKIEIFKFDAWRHESDPIRRAFIEEFIDFYHPNYINKQSADYTEILNEITKKKETQITTTTPKVKAWGVIFIAVYLLGISVASYILKNLEVPWTWQTSGAVWSYKSIIEWIFFSFLYLWPLIFLFSEQTRNIASVIVKETEKEIRNTTVKSVDPTAIEFKQYFSKILSDARKNKKHQCVIVLDNLDRMVDKEAIKILTTIYNFFCDRSNNIWIIVPFDPVALKSIFSSEEIAIDDAQNIYKSRRLDNVSRESFIEKMFNAQFYVPPPIVTDSHQYFMEKMDDAFGGDLDNLEKEGIFQIYGSGRYSAARNTPRKIIGFINNLVTLYRIWGDEICLKTQALYCLKRESIGTDLKQYLLMTSNRGEGVSFQQIALIANDQWNRDFAAIFFGVEKERALHILIGDELKKGLLQGKDDDEFLKIVEMHGFSHVLKEEILNSIHSMESLFQSALIAHSLYNIEQKSKYDLGFVWQILSKHIKNVQGRFPSDPKVLSGVIKLLEKSSSDWKDSFSKRIAASLFIFPADSPRKPSIDSEKPQPWLDRIAQINAVMPLEALIDDIFDPDFHKNMRQFFVKALSSAQKQNLNDLAPVFLKIFETKEEKFKLMELAYTYEDISELSACLTYLRQANSNYSLKPILNENIVARVKKSIKDDIDASAEPVQSEILKILRKEFDIHEI